MKLIDFLICDDIREEISGKHTLVGVYIDTIRFTSGASKKITWPIVYNLGIFARLFQDNPEEKYDKIEFKLFMDEKLLSNIVLRFSQPTNINHIFSQVIPIEIPSTGRLNPVFFISLGETLLHELRPDISILIEEEKPAS